MRLENKMHKWLKFFIKLLPFLWVLVLVVMGLGSSSDSGAFTSELYNFIIGEQFYEVNDFFFNSNAFNTPFSWLVDIVYPIFGNFNVFIVDTLFEGNYIIDTVLMLFEYWLIVDLVDLIFSAFRFIINLAHSWLDSFYERSKRGGK